MGFQVKATQASEHAVDNYAVILAPFATLPLATLAMAMAAIFTMLVSFAPFLALLVLAGPLCRFSVLYLNHFLGRVEFAESTHLLLILHWVPYIIGIKSATIIGGLFSQATDAPSSWYYTWWSSTGYTSLSIGRSCIWEGWAPSLGSHSLDCPLPRFSYQ